MTVNDVINLLHEQVQLCGYSQKTVAFNLGISAQYLSDILNGRRMPGNKVLRGLGLIKRVDYVRLNA